MWLRGIRVRGLRRFERLSLDLPAPAGRSCAHLVLLGPSGSGKSTLLEAMAHELEETCAGRPHPAGSIEAPGENASAEAVETHDRQIKHAHLGRPLRLAWTEWEERVAVAHAEGRFVAAHLECPLDMRTGAMPNAVVEPRARVAGQFPHWLGQRRADAEAARRAGDEGRAKRIEAGLMGVAHTLRALFGDPALELSLERGELRLSSPRYEGRPNPAELPRAQRAALALYAEIALRVEAARTVTDDPYLDPPGVVLIDGVEAGLDARLQRELLATLSVAFPQIQLVATTHAPLVALGLDHAIAHELGRGWSRPTHALRRAGLEALVAEMLGADAPAKREPARDRRPTSIPPPPPGRPHRDTLPAEGATLRNLPRAPSVPPPARLPPRRAASVPPPPPGRARRSTRREDPFGEH